MNLNELYNQLDKITNEIDKKSNKLTKRIETQFKAFEEVDIYHTPSLLKVIAYSYVGDSLSQTVTLLKISKGELQYQFITEELANKVKALYDDAYFKEVE